MSSTNILGLLGGLALFLYGMQMMSNGLESVAGNKMKDILEKLTSNRFLGRICKLWNDDIKSGRMDHHGS